VQVVTNGLGARVIAKRKSSRSRLANSYWSTPLDRGRRVECGHEARAIHGRRNPSFATYRERSVRSPNPTIPKCAFSGARFFGLAGAVRAARRVARYTPSPSHAVPVINRGCSGIAHEALAWRFTTRAKTDPIRVVKSPTLRGLDDVERARAEASERGGSLVLGRGGATCLRRWLREQQ
jgi:hypothetical protein